jgi:hypothetical protein
MKIKALIFCAIVFAGTLACEKNSNAELITPELLSADAPDDPQQGRVLQPVPEIIEALSPVNQSESLLRYDESRGHAELRGDYTMSLPSNPVKTLACGTNISGTLVDGSSKFNSRDYAAFRLAGDLGGRDDIYSFSVARLSVVTLNLRTTENLAMVLFEGTVSRAGVPTLLTTLRLKSAEDWTTSKSDYGDLVGPILLEAGTYIVVVDGPSQNESKYNLKMTCQEVGGNPGQSPNPNVLIHDNFDAYKIDADLSPQADHWVKYDALYNDAEVLKSSRNSNQFAYFANEGSIRANVLLRTGTRITGNWELKTKLWIHEDRTAKFSMVQRLSPGNTNNVVGAQIYFAADGDGLIALPGSNNNIPFRYSQNRWMTVEFELDFSNNKARLKIDGQEKGEWAANLTNATTRSAARLEAFHFTTSYGNAQFFLDDLSFSKQ